uniref:Uncharacterized protein n=1 Tax=mine drainage metagenome TaxID=410659 RepID=E6Q0F6_9ZZZZ
MSGKLEVPTRDSNRYPKSMERPKLILLGDLQKYTFNSLFRGLRTNESDNKNSVGNNVGGFFMPRFERSGSNDGFDSPPAYAF